MLLAITVPAGEARDTVTVLGKLKLRYQGDAVVGHLSGMVFQKQFACPTPGMNKTPSSKTTSIRFMNPFLSIGRPSSLRKIAFDLGRAAGVVQIGKADPGAGRGRFMQILQHKAASAAGGQHAAFLLHGLRF